ncbi:MAG TPA: FlgD immunoglobulin-like domain containing protein [Geobacteraceae bacterium]
MKKYITPVLVGLLLCLQGVSAPRSEAACAKVSMVILQQLTVERVAFDAKLVISNGIPDQSLQNMRVDVNITDASGNVKNDIFFVRPPVLTGVSGALDGTGSVAAASSGEAHWLIIPSPGAGGQSSAGTDYWVGATLSYTIGTTQETIPINPAKITVKPMPQLVLDYFMPYQVIGDNPFTPQVEQPVPYPLAVRVMNDGYGTAANLRIDSAQPRIVDNRQGLLIDFKILGAAVNDGAVSPSLTVNFGDLPSKKGATASWQMISSLSGHFIEFKTSFTHSSELGGDLTSLITATNPHYLTHMVRVNLPGRDARLDFLGYDTDLTNNPDKLPQYLYESEIPNGSTNLSDSQTPVTVVLPTAQPARPTPNAPSVALALPTGATGWIYTKMADPSQGLLMLLDVVRADGVHLDPHNFWVDQGLDANFKPTWTLQFIDYRATAGTPGAYTLVFTQPDADTTPPTTALTFDGPATGTNPAYITPQTRLILTATDNGGGSGVDGMYKEVTGQDTDFVPALPFNLTTAGTYNVQYYSVDRAGNMEATKSATVVVVNAAPMISSFAAAPASFAPQAPRGVAATRSATLKLTTTSGAGSLPVQIEIAFGAPFQQANVVRTLKGTATSGAEFDLSWDGRDANGRFVQAGAYTARATVTDGLDNSAEPDAPSHTVTADAALSVVDWFPAVPVDPNPAADQMHPRTFGTKVVWQDMRNGRWDIYLKDMAGGAAQLIPSASPDRELPAINGNYIVWQDYRNGTWDIYGYDLSSGTEFPISTEAGDQTRPVIAGNWVAWQDNRSGNGDIYAYNLATRETVQVTFHERDQIHPAINGTTLVWEDYRNGAAEVYQYDLTSRTESRITFDTVDQILPAAFGITLAWTDLRNGQKDIYAYDPVWGAVRLTYGQGDHSQTAISGSLVIFTDYEAGADDPNLSFRDLSSGVGGRLTSDPARQEEPAIATNAVVWQDSRDGKYQIYSAPFATEPVPVEVDLKQGFNLVAVGDVLKSAYPTASALIAAKKTDLGIGRLLLFDQSRNAYLEATAGGEDFSLVKGSGLVIYAGKPGTIKLAESGESAFYTLLPGTNQIGILTVTYGYSAYDMMRSVGLDNIQSVRRFDTTAGAWQTVTVRTTAAGNGLVGANFVIQPGDGLIITMKNRVDGWTP